MTPKMSNEVLLYGIGGSPGICIGKAYLVGKEGVEVVPQYQIDSRQVNSEKKRFKIAVKKATDELRKIINETSEKFREQARILETHVSLLKDKMLYGRTIDVIAQERINAEWALKRVISKLKLMFESMSDPYLQQRAEDIFHVCDRIMKNLVGTEGIDISKIDKRVILVARDLSPAETSQIQLEKVMGFVTDSGGRASHSSIIARSLEIPAVLGLEKATNIIYNEDLIIVDGTAGVVVINPSEQTLIEAKKRKAHYEKRKAVYARSGHLPAKTQDGLHLAVMGNIEMPEEVVAVLDKGGDGIGLYRTEFQYLARTDFPSEEELFEQYKDVIDVMPDKPITIRTLDINGDKAVAHTADQKDINPVLGLRGIRYCLQRLDVFKTQLRAILRAAYHGQVRILLPMISGVEEVLTSKQILAQVAESLDREGLPFQKDIQVGIMVEVPSAVIMADAIAREIDFFSIGTNDLIQYAMAIDRGNRHVAHLYNPLHPAVIRLLKQITDAGQRNNIPVFMCGEMAADPIHVPILLGLGLQELSANAQAIPLVKNAVRNLNIHEAQRFLEQVLKQTTTAKIEQMIKETYSELLGNNNHHEWEH